MRERLWVRVGLACLIVGLNACSGRSTARLSQVEKTRIVNDTTSTARVEMEYDDAGYLQTLDFSVSGELERTTRLSYDEGRLVELVTTLASGAVTAIELEWRNGQLREMEYTEDDDRWVKTFEYDEERPSLVTKIEMERPYGLGSKLRVLETFAWNESGQLAESIRESRTRTDLLDLEVVTTETSERRFNKSGELDRFTVYNATGGSTAVQQWNMAYEGGRLDEIDADAGENYRFEYEANRMVEIDYRSSGSRVSTELTYEEGGVAGDLRWSPPAMPGALHFDLAGQSFPDIMQLAPGFLLGAP